MSTPEDRIAALERKVAALELRRMYDEGVAWENIPPEQGRNLREINENMAILLSVVGKQRQDIQAIITALGTIRDHMEQRSNSNDQHFATLEEKVEQMLKILTSPQKQGERSFLNRALGIFPDETDK